MTQETDKQRGRGIYLLPNLLTTAGLFAAFYSIVASMNNDFQLAAIAVAIAAIADLLDGRIARLTQSQSTFGGEYDSLADMVSFGLAPALIVYSWGLHTLGKIGWLISFLYTACAALRLARFNAQLEGDNKRYFQGLSSPAAAGVVVCLVWASTKYGVTGDWLIVTAALLTAASAVLMVSNVRYNSFKDLGLSGRVPFVTTIVLVLVIIGISLDPPLVLFGVSLVYALSGVVGTLRLMWRHRQARRRRKKG